MKKLDANETMFFTKELNHVKSNTYMKKFPELKATALFPVSMEANPGDETISYQMYTEVGIAKIIGNYSDDLPASTVKGEEIFSPIRTIGTHYAYSIKEIRSAAKANKPLRQMKANSAKRAIDQVINTIAWRGDAEYNLVGILNHPNIPVDTSVNKIDATSTPDQILAILNAAVTDTIELTNGVEIPNTMVMTIKAYSYIQRTARSTTSDTTILQFFLSNNPSITRIDWAVELAAVDPAPSGGAGPVDCLITYNSDPDKFSLEIPSPFEQLEPEKQNLTYKIDCIAECGGIIAPYPLSLRIVEDI